ncbi:diacylglycerol kinase [Paenibacillus xanthanilyticus]|uniref:Diacylglycerol kinase n=1 Tax=Paenibacillus xanthanilyticus TaxID=1783531 RepID=A0ABV8KDC1_9BACL
MRRFWQNVGFAVEGLRYATRTQRHMRFHWIASTLAVAAGLWLGLSGVEWAVLALLIAAVLAAELLNTAVECVVDLASPQQHPLAKAAKDTAAAAVLVIAAAAVVIGAILFLPHLANKFGW